MTEEDAAKHELAMKVKIVKEVFKFDDGNLCQGVRFILAPKVSKFISIGNESMQLLEFMNPNVYHWFKGAPVGAEATLVEYYPTPKGDISK